MKEFKYSLDEITLVKNLLLIAPNKIWWNYVSFIFEYDEYYITLNLVSEVAATQNRSDEAIITSIKKENTKFVATGAETLVCICPAVLEISITRSLLYFTNYKKVLLVERWFKKLKLLVKMAYTTVNPLEVVLHNVTGGNQEICCHPDSKEATGLDNRYTNIIDTGILLKTDRGFLPAYVVSNGYGFRVSDEKFFYQSDELTEDFEYTKLIDVTLDYYTH